MRVGADESAPAARSAVAERRVHAAMRLPCRPPFHLEATVRVLQRRPTNLVDVWYGEHYRRAIRIGNRPAVIDVANCGTIDSPDVRLRVLPSDFPADKRDEAARVAREVLGLNVDLTLPQRWAEAEPALRLTAVALRGMRPPRYPDLFETFANVVPFQQLSLEAGMAASAQLVRRFGQTMIADSPPCRAFPAAEAIAGARIASLKRCGLSTRKSHALRAIAELIASGALTSRALEVLRSTQALERLMELPGIGPWSAALVLLRGLGRLDVFPEGDTGAETSLATLLRLRSRASLQRVIDRFAEYRGYLYFYGIASRLLAAGLVRAAPAPR